MIPSKQPCKAHAFWPARVGLIFRTPGGRCIMGSFSESGEVGGAGWVSAESWSCKHAAGRCLRAAFCKPQQLAAVDKEHCLRGRPKPTVESSWLPPAARGLLQLIKRDIFNLTLWLHPLFSCDILSTPSSLVFVSECLLIN